MYVLIMIVLLGGQGVTLNHLYYEDELSCSKAATEFEAHKGRDVKLKAFCIKGDNN